MTIQTDIQHKLEQAVQSLGISFSGEIEVTQSAHATHGDYTSNIAMHIFPQTEKGIWKSPRALAEAIVEKMGTSLDIDSISVAGAGFINFRLSNAYFTNLLGQMSKENPTERVVKSKKRAVVEYSSPNIAKPFTIGHLRSTIIGDAVANLLETTGWEVYRDNHLGDWGTQFGKLIVAIKRWGNVEEIGQSENPVKDLVHLYIKFHTEAENDPALEDEGREWFTKLERGDQEARKLWQMCIDWSWQEFDRIYKKLNVHFTENAGRGYGESFFEDKMQAVIKELKQSGYLQEGKEGATLFFFPNDELPALMILKKDGSTLYATRDLATDKFRLEHYGHDIHIINEVGGEQELYFRQIFRIEELVGWYKPHQRVHVKHGLYRFLEGKMSTRKGNVIWLDDVISEAIKRASDITARSGKIVTDNLPASENGEVTRVQFSELSGDELEVAKAVAVGALKWNDLKRASHFDVTFDWDEILNMKGNSGPYIQYTAVRCGSVLQKATTQTASVSIDPLNEEERAVVRQLEFFQETVLRAAREYAPHYMCTYLYELASGFNTFYNQHKILGSGVDETKRLLITAAVKNVLQFGLEILGISVPSKM